MAVISRETSTAVEVSSEATLNHAKIAKKSPSVQKKRNSKPDVRVVGGRIYDPKNGKTCHQVANLALFSGFFSTLWYKFC
jgi:hypothetical protein